MKTITWVTPEYFIETDIYVVPELAKYYIINWIIEYGTDKNQIPFYLDLNKLRSTSNLHIEWKNRSMLLQWSS